MHEIMMLKARVGNCIFKSGPWKFDREVSINFSGMIRSGEMKLLIRGAINAEN